jgi:molybdate transport repressor ModE-like protein
MFDWNDLRYFLAIARGGSIGIAAKALGVNQSTVQRRLRALEVALNCSLAERQAGGYRLTALGQQLLAYAEQVETTVSTLQRQSATLDNRATGLVKLTSHVTVGQRIMKSGFLDCFHSRHPSITVELIMEQRKLDLSKGEADTLQSEAELLMMTPRWLDERLQRSPGEFTPAIHLSNVTAGRPGLPTSTASALSNWLMRLRQYRRRGG